MSKRKIPKSKINGSLALKINFAEWIKDRKYQKSYT